jgi:cytochrome P450/NADPH-cytochrome P450 reductase
LSFLFHYLLKTPRSVQAIREEVDRLCGDQPIRFEQLQKLEYLDAALKETLRLKSTAPAFGVTPKNQDEVIGGKYLIKKGQAVSIILDALHVDPKVWGDDAEVFRYVKTLHKGSALMMLDLNECSMEDLRIFHLIAGNPSVTE